MLKKVIDFVNVDLWRMDLNSLPGYQRFLFKQARIFILSIRGFQEDKAILRASALTFYTMLSIVPIIAMAFAIAKGFGFEKRLEENILAGGGQYQDIWEQVFEFANALLANTPGGILGGIGVVILLYTVLQVMGHIEESLNDIWQVKQARSYFRKFSDYFSIMLLAPVLLILSSSITVFIKTQVTNITESIEILGYFSSVIFFFINLFPYVLIWFAFALTYIIMPNTKVNFKPAFIAGIIAGSGFIFLEWAYIYFQFGVAKYNAIYGSFAALPLFLIWLQTSWVIVLFGAEFSFSFQNVKNFEFEYDTKNLSNLYRKKVAIVVASHVVKNFAVDGGLIHQNEIAEKLGLPIRLTKSILDELCDSKILISISSSEKEEFHYQPAKPIENLTISSILQAIEGQGIATIPVKGEIGLEKINTYFENLGSLMNKSTLNLKLTDL